MIVFAWSVFLSVVLAPAFGYFEDKTTVWQHAKCNEYMIPDNCDLSRSPLITVEDMERCAPAKLPLHARNYYIAWAGKGTTFRENRKAFERIFIKPKMLRGASVNNLDVNTLGQKVSIPVGISPSALHTMADPSGENATAAAAAALNTVMILSSHSGIRLEEVAASVKGKGGHLWMQLYVFKNRQYTVDLVKRAEKNGFEAIVLNVDADIFPPLFCDAKSHPGIRDARLGNYPVTFSQFKQGSVTFHDITWLKSLTNLPVVVKGILSAEDAVKAINAGASAIMVSNHGGRQLDGAPAAIDALPEVVKAVNNYYPRRDVYLDSGVRTGYDVYKALARGAKMVFVGRPALWGLALEGQRGVERVLHIFKSELNNTMILAGNSQLKEINGQCIIPSDKTHDYENALKM